LSQRWACGDGEGDDDGLPSVWGREAGHSDSRGPLRLQREGANILINAAAGRRTTDNGQRTTDDGRRTTDDGRRTTEDDDDDDDDEGTTGRDL
jgi:hypothetical protein